MSYKPETPRIDAASVEAFKLLQVEVTEQSTKAALSIILKEAVALEDELSISNRTIENYKGQMEQWKKTAIENSENVELLNYLLKLSHGQNKRLVEESKK